MTMSRSEFAALLELIQAEESEVRVAGQKEYAHDDDNAMGNFERIGRQLGLSREKVLWVYLAKHMDGILAYLNGHKSQREDIRGRIKDARMYLALLRAMVEDSSKQETFTMRVEFESQEGDLQKLIEQLSRDGKRIENVRFRFTGPMTVKTVEVAELPGEGSSVDIPGVGTATVNYVFDPEESKKWETVPDPTPRLGHRTNLDEMADYYPPQAAPEGEGGPELFDRREDALAEERRRMAIFDGPSEDKGADDDEDVVPSMIIPVNGIFAIPSGHVTMNGQMLRHDGGRVTYENGEMTDFEFFGLTPNPLAFKPPTLPNIPVDVPMPPVKLPHVEHSSVHIEETTLNSDGFVYIQGRPTQGPEIHGDPQYTRGQIVSRESYQKSHHNDGLCHAYAECENIGWPGCVLPRGHDGNHRGPRAVSHAAPLSTGGPGEWGDGD